MTAVLVRLRDTLAAMRPDQRHVAAASLAVIVSLLLPWYTKETTTATLLGRPQTEMARRLAIFVPSFVEASILIVALAVIALMLARGARARFFLPVGDRPLVMAAGAWTCLLVFYRFVDQPHGQSGGQISISYNLAWGIFFGLLAAALLLYTGSRLHDPPPEADVEPTAGGDPSPGP